MSISENNTRGPSDTSRSVEPLSNRNTDCPSCGIGRSVRPGPLPVQAMGFVLPCNLVHANGALTARTQKKTVHAQ